MSAPARDQGHVLPLLIGYVVIALSMLVVVVDITAVQVQRQRLYRLSDSAALAAAAALDQEAFYREGLALAGVDAASLPVDPGRVRAEAERFIAEAGPDSRLAGVAVVESTDVDAAQRVRVTLRAQARLPVVGAVVHRWRGGVPLLATSRARSRVIP